MTVDVRNPKFMGMSPVSIGLAPQVEACTPNDTANLPNEGPVYVGGAGDLHFLDGNGTELTLPVVAGGTTPFVVTKVFATGTTATALAVLVMR
ncbi:MAG: hypothetical protein AAF192_03920 [Pseudomonadota bacterium]